MKSRKKRDRDEERGETEMKRDANEKREKGKREERD